MIKLNLGCGLWVHKDWVNVDKFYTREDIKNHPQGIVEDGAEYIQADIMRLPFEDNYADEADLHQVIEHFGISDTIPLLTEICRVLKPRGFVRLSCPSFNGLCVNWVGNEINSTEFDYAQFKYLNHEFYGLQTQDGEHHKCAITPKYLQYCAEHAGFKELEMIMFPRGSRMPEEGYGLMQPIHRENDERSFFRTETLYAKLTK